MSIASAGCLLWLERMQPVLAAIAACALTYETWLVMRRPVHRRTRAMMAILWSSIGLSALVSGLWVVLWLRYR